MSREKILNECLQVAEEKNYNGIFILPTGSGKGRFMIECAKKINPQKIIYMCDNKNLRDNMFKDELIKWNASELIDRTTFTCYQSAYKWDTTSTDLVLYDEFDFALSKQYSNVFRNIESPHKIFVSATLDKIKRQQALSISDIVYEKTFGEFVEKGILNKVRYHIVNYNLTDRENEQYLEYNKKFRSLLSDSSYNFKKLNSLKIQRKQFLSSLTNGANAARWLLDEINLRNQRSIVFTGLSKQADRISKYSYHSKSDEDNLTKFSNGEINELVVVEKITRGVNISNVKHIIHESIGTSKTKLVQKTGRGMRLDVNDTLNVYFLLPHYYHKFKGRQPTIVKDWIINSTEDMNISNTININYK